MPNFPRLLSPRCHTTSLRRMCISMSRSPYIVGARSHLSQGILPDPRRDRKIMSERRWKEFFSDPSQWWDHRSEKVNPRYPDFKHKRTGDSLWLANRFTPPWVEAQLVTIAPGLLQSHNFSWNVRLRRHLKAADYKESLNLFQQMRREGMMPDKFTFLAVLKACSNLRSLEEGRDVHEQILQRGCESDINVANCLVDMYAKCGSIQDACRVFNKMRERNVVSWSSMIVAYVKSEQGLKALELFREMQEEGVEPNTVTFVGVLNACASVVALEEGRRVHEQIIQRGCQSHVYVANCLIDMYAKCGSIEDAWSVFKEIPQRDLVSWNTMLGAYVKSEQGLKALELFPKMQQEGLEPNTVTFVGMLNACASVAALEKGRCVHEQIIRKGYQSDVYVATCLIDMYAKCGSIEDAWSVFNKIRDRDVVSWSVMIVGYVKTEQMLKALELFHKMQDEGVEPDVVTFAGALNACTNIAEGKLVHEQIIRRGCQSDIYVANCLVDMYAKCGSIEDAWSVFSKMRERDVISWTVMIVGYVKSDQGLKALQLFQKMQQEGLEADIVTFVGALNACASIGALEEGRHIHEQIICSGCESNVCVATCLVDMYAKCESMEDACFVFTKMQERGLVSWSAMIVGYVKSGQGLKALEIFREMDQEGVEPDAVTFVGALNACASVGSLEEGRRVHKQIIQRECGSDVYVATCLVDMYAKCGSIEDARSVFNKMRDRDVVSWSAMIGGYAMHGRCKKAIGVLKQMGKKSIEIDQITFTCLLSACSHGGLVKEGLRYFNTMTSHYSVLSTREHYACMVDLLGRAGRLEEADQITKKMPMERDRCVWMSLLSACRIHGNIDMAERTAKRCWESDPQNASTHVLLSNIYAAAGNWNWSAAFGKEGLKRKVRRELGHAGIHVNNLVHSFVVDNEQHQVQQMHAELERLSVQMNKAEYIPDTRFMLPVSKNLTCEKLAIANGLISTGTHSL